MFVMNVSLQCHVSPLELVIHLVIGLAVYTIYYFARNTVMHGQNILEIIFRTFILPRSWKVRSRSWSPKIIFPYATFVVVLLLITIVSVTSRCSLLVLEFFLGRGVPPGECLKRGTEILLLLGFTTCVSAILLLIGFQPLTPSYTKVTTYKALSRLQFLPFSTWKVCRLNMKVAFLLS